MQTAIIHRVAPTDIAEVVAPPMGRWTKVIAFTIGLATAVVGHASLMPRLATWRTWATTHLSIPATSRMAITNAAAMAASPLAAPRGVHSESGAVGPAAMVDPVQGAPAMPSSSGPSDAQARPAPGVGTSESLPLAKHRSKGGHAHKASRASKRQHRLSHRAAASKPHKA
jgi:hypothetical protein